MAASNVFAGKDVILGVGASSSVAYTALGALRSAELNVTRDTADATNVDSSAWRETIPTIASWTMTAEALTLSTAATSMQDEARGYLGGETRAYWWFLNSTAAGAWTQRGWGYVTNWSMGGGLEDVQVSNFEITGDGKLTEAATT
jgi:predicted secreted protein